MHARTHARTHERTHARTHARTHTHTHTQHTAPQRGLCPSHVWHHHVHIYCVVHVYCVYTYCIHTTHSNWTWTASEPTCVCVCVCMHVPCTGVCKRTPHAGLRRGSSWEIFQACLCLCMYADTVQPNTCKYTCMCIHTAPQRGPRASYVWLWGRADRG